MEAQVYNLKRLAIRLGVSERSARRLVLSGILPRQIYSSRILVDSRIVEAYILHEIPSVASAALNGERIEQICSLPRRAIKPDSSAPRPQGSRKSSLGRIWTAGLAE